MANFKITASTKQKSSDKKHPLFNRGIIIVSLILLCVFLIPIPRKTHTSCIAVIGTDCETSTWQFDLPLGLMLMVKLISPKYGGIMPQNTPMSTTTLLEKAQKHGLVRVIVSVHVAEPPENWLRDSALEAAHKQNISEAQNSLLSDLVPYQIKDVLKFETTPAISMTVNANALQFLYDSPKVRGIEEDQLRSTQ
jgi:hypothetical protein